MQPPEGPYPLTGNAPPEAILRAHQGANPFIAIDRQAGPVREAIELRVVEMLVGSSTVAMAQLYHLLASIKPGESQVLKTLNPRQLEVIRCWALHGVLEAIKVVTPQGPTPEQQLAQMLTNTQRALMALVSKTPGACLTDAELAAIGSHHQLLPSRDAEAGQINYTVVDHTPPAPGVKPEFTAKDGEATDHAL